MNKIIDRITYKQVKAEKSRDCTGCVASDNTRLCIELSKETYCLTEESEDKIYIIETSEKSNTVQEIIQKASIHILTEHLNTACAKYLNVETFDKILDDFIDTTNDDFVYDYLRKTLETVSHNTKLEYILSNLSSSNITMINEIKNETYYFYLCNQTTKIKALELLEEKLFEYVIKHNIKEIMNNYTGQFTSEEKIRQPYQKTSEMKNVIYKEVKERVQEYIGHYFK